MKPSPGVAAVSCLATPSTNRSADISLDTVKAFIAKWTRHFETMRREHDAALHLMDLDKHEDIHTPDDNMKDKDAFEVVVNLVSGIAHVSRRTPPSGLVARARCGWPYLRNGTYDKPGALCTASDLPKCTRCWKSLSAVLASSDSEAA